MMDDLELRQWALDFALRAGAMGVANAVGLASAVLAFLGQKESAPTVKRPSHGTTCDRVWELHEQGMRRGEIAKQLGITAQSAAAALTRRRRALGIPAIMNANATFRRPVNGHAPE